MQAAAEPTPTEPLGPVALVVLGLLRRSGDLSGYDIKALVDTSARFFWAASYGQIYPELRRLSASRLVEGTDAPRGERARVVYRITAAGIARLEAWLAVPAERCEVRDEHLLKLFLSTPGDTPDTRERLATMVRHHERRAAELAQIDTSCGAPPGDHPRLVLDYGRAFHAFVVGWCREQSALLPEPDTTERSR